MLSRMVRFVTLALLVTASAPPRAVVAGIEDGAVEERHQADPHLVAEAVEIEERVEDSSPTDPWAVPSDGHVVPRIPLLGSASADDEAPDCAPSPAEAAGGARAPPGLRIV